MAIWAIIILILIILIIFFSKSIDVKKHSTEKLLMIYKKLNHGDKYFMDIEEELKKRNALLSTRDDKTIEKNDNRSAVEHGKKSTKYLESTGYSYIDLFKMSNNHPDTFTEKVAGDPSIYVITTSPVIIAAYYLAFHRNTSPTEEDHNDFYNGVRLKLENIGIKKSRQESTIDESQRSMIAGIIDLIDDENFAENHPDGSVLSQFFIKKTCENYHIEYKASSEIKLATKMLDAQIRQEYSDLNKKFNHKHEMIL